MSAALSAMSSQVVRASWDTQQRLSYNPNAPRKPKKNPISQPNSLPPTPSPTPSPSITLTPQAVSELLKRNTIAQGVVTKFGDTYLGYERWMPSPPKVEKPRSVYNAATLAYIVDSIYELYARRHFLFPPLSIDEYNDRVTAVVRCEAQDALLQKLLSDDCLSKEERDVLRWGKNIGSAKTRTKKRAGAAVYNRASSLETLLHY
ncbi:mini-ribonuclease 3 isoform X1 [Jatropha curcas]|uniref:mini-ribonuclease 3 isoform X1 n=1 Tax=Jatropha curcas TaxID=180498 RepID=UPI0018936512|nr:mini-ribonuclease 3 isoform X1 [Jatropha curcas]